MDLVNRFRQSWSIGIYAGDSPLHLLPHERSTNPVLTRAHVTDIPASFVADPFMIRAGDVWHMFFEAKNIVSDKGEIGLALSKDGFDWQYRQIVLAEPFHLSYPYVFEHDGGFYMIPETLQPKYIRLYKATSFPYRWTLLADLIPGANADPSIFFWAGNWWMFACSRPFGHDELRLFFAGHLTGPWREHPRSPIVKDNRRIARPAGRVLVCHDRVIRFAQDCFPRYGTQVRAFEILELTPSSYRERECENNPILTPGESNWNRDGMHHVDAHRNSDGSWIACVDGNYRAELLPAKPVFKINVYAENHGWLFEDLKQHFKTLGRVNDFEVCVSDRPLVQADAWIALRTKEAGAAPDLSRTVVCVHDLLSDDEMYQPNGSRHAVREAAAVALCHPQQRQILNEAGISLQRAAVLERPLGALMQFVPRDRNPDLFTVGWVGRNHPRKRLEWFVQAIQQFGPEDFCVTLIGAGLDDAAETLRAGGVNVRLFDREAHPISMYPRLYQGLDCLVITSATEAGPLTLFEALATGLPVVSTPVGWAPFFADKAPRYVRLADSPTEIAARLEQLRTEREEMFERRFEIAGLVSEWTLESWLLDVVNLARSVVVI